MSQGAPQDTAAGGLNPSHSPTPATYLCEAAQQQPLVVQQAHEVVGGGGQEGAGEQLLQWMRSWN